MGAEHFWARVRTGSLFECWAWLGALNGAGYGVYGGGMAHRAAYESANGPIAAGMQIDHLCRVRWCVNPAHLEAVTPSENRRRGDAVAPRKRGRLGVCHRGHVVSGENLYLVLDRDGHYRRKCRACRRSYRDRSLASRASP